MMNQVEKADTRTIQVITDEYNYTDKVFKLLNDLKRPVSNKKTLDLLLSIAFS